MAKITLDNFRIHARAANEMDYIPVFLLIFKAIVLGSGMIFAIKWHYDQDRKVHGRAVIGAVGKMTAILVLLLLCLLFATFKLATMLGMDLTLPR